MKKPIICLVAICMCAAMAGCATQGGPSEGAAGSSPALPASSAAGSSPALPASSAEATSAPVSAEPPILKDCAVIHETDFGGVYIEMPIEDFCALGFDFGDSVDIAFSNGFTLEGIPYFNGFYVNTGDPLLVGYPGYPYIRAGFNNGDDLWETAGLSDGDTATVTIAEADGYADVQDAFDIVYTDLRSDYDSDVMFANYRALAGGDLKEGVLYRSASPVDNEHNRAAYVGQLMAADGVQFMLNLSDDEEKVQRYMAENEAAGVDDGAFRALYEQGNAALLRLKSNYRDEGFKQSLAAGLVKMTDYDGPYLIHCVEGKDRTGFVCALLEGLAGASYQEIIDDYMITYANYYRVTEEDQPSRYNAIKNLNIDGMLRYLAGDDNADLVNVDYAACARAYLLDSGMTDEQIDALIARIC